jgi:hypothetical protein
MPYASIAYIPDFLSDEGDEKSKRRLWARLWPIGRTQSENYGPTNLLSINQKVIPKEALR